MTLNYEQSVSIPLKSMISFKEYELDRHEHKKLRMEVHGELFSIITPEDKLDCDTISLYYKGKVDIDYPALSYHPFVRLVLIVGSDKLGMPIYRVVSLNKYYMLTGLQTLEYKEQQTDFTPELPNQILGFNSYRFGEKFKE